MHDILEGINVFLWGVPVLALILLGGLYFTVRLRFIQLRCLGEAMHLTVSPDNPGEAKDCAQDKVEDYITDQVIDKAEECTQSQVTDIAKGCHAERVVGKSKNMAGKKGVSAFGALCTSLAACLGTGNIVGVALAVQAGGPGAVFWMAAAAFIGMSVMYAECYLAVKYREKTQEGSRFGGPFLYIVKGLGKKYRPLAEFFAISGMCAGLFGIGTFTQTNSIIQAVQECVSAYSLSSTGNMDEGRLQLIIFIAAIIITAAAAMVILGGVNRIAAFASVVVPFMAAGFMGVCLIILFRYANRLPQAIGLVVKGAFCPRAVLGGGAVSVWTVMRIGVSRGIFSNEAGMGAAPIAAAASDENSPRRQGLVSMLGAFVDTCVMCVVTGLVLVVTGVWKSDAVKGVTATIAAVEEGLSIAYLHACAIITVSLTFFAFTSILGWNHYAVSCLDFLTGRDGWVRRKFQILYIAAVFAGCFLKADTVWLLADIFNACMALSNMPALWMLRRQIE